MPTISQLPAAGTISAADELPLSQDGVACAASVGALLSSTQPAIIVDSPALLGRTSIGAGGPEPVSIGIGMGISTGTLVANGSDHGGFPLISNFSVESDLVISNQGSPMLMHASLLRDLFSAGENVSIDPNGTISAATGTATGGTGVSISGLDVIIGMGEQDLVAISHAGSNCAIAYDNFFDGITIDQAQVAAPAGDSDAIWVAQGSNVMVSQTLSEIWIWMANKLPTYRLPIVEITTNINLDTTVHNGRILVCSQPVTLTPLTTNMGAGFQCTVINASEGNITLGSGFVSSNGNPTLTPWQSATLFCIAYSAGTIAFATMPTTGGAIAVPGQVSGLLASGTTAATTTISWQAPSAGGAAISYIIQLRVTGIASWSTNATVAGVTNYVLTELQPATSYDISIIAQNSGGPGAVSAILTMVTASATQQNLPLQVTGMAAISAASTAIQLSWSAQSGNNPATSFTVQYRITGSSSWTFSVAGLTGTSDTISNLQAATSYDFSIIGVNGVGSGPVSATVTAVTLAATGSVSSIAWNLLPSGIYTHGGGAIGINAAVSPTSAPIQFGFSPSSSTSPTSWTPATFVNTNLWGAYVTTPSAAGTWYTWAEGLDGSARTVSPSPFVVQ